MRLLLLIVLLSLTGCVTPTYIIKIKSVEKTWIDKEGKSVKSMESESIMQRMDFEERLMPDVIKFKQPLIYYSWWTSVGL